MKNEMNWRKHRYYRSDPLQNPVGKSTVRTEERFRGFIFPDQSTEWFKISKSSLNELKERGLLSDLQIVTAERRLGLCDDSNQKNKKPAYKKRVKKTNPDSKLIDRLARIDLTTKEGLIELKSILETNPNALSLMSKANKLRDKVG